MPIPPLRANGTLPPGEHHATLTEIIAAFPPITPERQELNQALLDALVAFVKLKSLAPDIIIYIDGSFVTSKRSPVDIDILILTDVMDEIQIKAFFNQECPISMISFDLHADPLGHPQLVQFFTATRSLRPKGATIMRDTQPPITNEEEYQGYQAGLAHLNAECVFRAQMVTESKDDPVKLQRALEALDNMYHKRKGIVDAIRDYERQQATSVQAG